MLLLLLEYLLGLYTDLVACLREFNTDAPGTRLKGHHHHELPRATAQVIEHVVWPQLEESDEGGSGLGRDFPVGGTPEPIEWPHRQITRTTLLRFRDLHPIVVHLPVHSLHQRQCCPVYRVREIYRYRYRYIYIYIYVSVSE